MKFEPLDSKKHNRKDFDCGVESLNTYIKRFANQDHKRDLSRTFVLAEENQIIGYYSISAHSVSRAFLPETINVGGYEDIPFILLGRLAIDKRHQGQGLGDTLIFDALTKTSELARSIGIFGIIVDSINEKSTQFYEGFGFQKLSSNANRLFLPMEVIAGFLKEVYTTNAIESLNMTLRKVIKNKRVFPSDNSVFKVLFLAIETILKKWTMPIHNWKAAMKRFTIECEGRIQM